MEILNLINRPEAIYVIARWFFDEWGHKRPGNTLQQTIDRLTEKIHHDATSFFMIAVDGNGVLGVAGLKKNEMPEYPQRIHWLSDVFVEPTARGRGLGTALTQAIVNKARELDIDELWLQTETQQHLYARSGWREAECIVRDEKSISIMVRKIKYP